MGNCCKTAPSSMEWGGEDWDCLKSENNNNNKLRKRSSSKVFDEGQGLSSGKVKKENLSEALRASCDANGRVKIKISKKELGELLKGIEKQNQMKKKQVRLSNSSAEQVLLGLMKAREHAKQDHDSQDKTWRPVLHTITEGD